MNIDEIIIQDSNYYMNTFGKRTPVCFESGKGISLFATDGKEYKDFFAGIAVNILGHNHPALTEAISEQAHKLIHVSNLYYNLPQLELAKILVEKTFAGKVFFANSGAEANEGAIKLARAFFHKKGLPEKNEIITLKNSFHGRTLTTVTATGQPKYQKYYTPLTPGFKYAERNSLEAIAELADADKTCAVMLEPIQGESGVHPMEPDYINGIKKICDEKNILLIFDEVQTGIGRTGKLFAYEHFGIAPDILTTAKALGGGVPIGAVLASNEAAGAFEPGDHGTTFGGNPLACSAGIAVLNTIYKENLLENAEVIGDYLKASLITLADSCGVISDVRGKGLMIAVDFSDEIAARVKNEMFNAGWLIGSVGSNTLRLLPPLIITRNDVDDFVSSLKAVLQTIMV